MSSERINLCEANLNIDECDSNTNRKKTVNEYHTVFTKRLADDLNSTFKSEENDYRGGLVHWKKNPVLISPDPSNTSCGFENTFKILEKQIRHQNSNFSDLDSSDDAANNDNRQSELELELNIRQRLRELSNRLHPNDRNISVNQLSSPTCSSFENASEKADDEESLDLIYHIAKNKNGEVHLKVLRSLFIDNGKFHHSFKTKSNNFFIPWTHIWF